MKNEITNSKICVIGGHKTTEILINNLKKKKDKFDIYYYVPKKNREVILYSNLKKKIKSSNFFYSFTLLKEIEKKIIKKKYDYIFAIGLSQIISNQIIKSVKKKIIGFHPTYLPFGKGRSSVAWNIRLKKNGDCSFFFITNEIADSGDIFLRKKIKISNKDNAQTYTEKYLKNFNLLSTQIITNFEYFMKKKIKVNFRKKTSYYNLLKPDDSFIDWKQKKKIISELIAFSTKPHHGSYSFIGKNLYKIYPSKIKIEPSYQHYAEPGTVIEIKDNNCLVKTIDGHITVQLDKKIKIGQRFTSFTPYILYKIMHKLNL